MCAARRSLLTAFAAGALLVGLWFVPSTHARADIMRPQAATQYAEAPGGHAASTASAGRMAPQARPADGHGADTRYLIGSTLALGLGAGVAYAMRRNRASAS